MQALEEMVETRTFRKAQLVRHLRHTHLRIEQKTLRLNVDGVVEPCFGSLSAQRRYLMIEDIYADTNLLGIEQQTMFCATMLLSTLKETNNPQLLAGKTICSCTMQLTKFFRTYRCERFEKLAEIANFEE